MPKFFTIKNETGLAPVILLFSAFCICFLVYYPGLSGIFLVDDKVTLQSINNQGGVTDWNSLLSFIFSNRSGPSGRPFSMLSFLIDDQAWPGDPASYKYTNIMIHILCGLCIFVFLNKLLNLYNRDSKSSIYIPIFATAVWLVHPLNVSTTLYVVQRMTQLSTLFSILALAVYIWGRQNQCSNVKLSYISLSIGVPVFISLAVLSKENGVLTFIYILTIEFTLLRNLPKHKWFNWWLSIFIIAPTVLVIVYFVSYWHAVTFAYKFRDFSMVERLLTESRVLIYYLYQILIPQSGGTGLFHDDFPVSKGIFSPATTITSILLIFGLIGLALFKCKKYPVLSFSILWFFAGHLLESTFIPLEIYFEHRNYMPMLGPLLGVSFYIFKLINHQEQNKLQRIIYALPVIVFTFSTLLTYQSTTLWGDPLKLFKVWAIEKPDSLRAQRVYGHMLAVNNEVQASIAQLQATYQKFPFDISLPISINNIACQHAISPPYQFAQIINAVPSSRYTSKLVPAVKSMIELNSTGRCTSISLSEIHQLMYSLENVKQFRRASLSELFILHSELYVNERKLSPAIEMLDKAFKTRKEWFIPVRQAQLLMSAGLYEDALEYLNKAKLLEQRKGFHSRSNIKYIMSIETQINKAMNS